MECGEIDSIETTDIDHYGRLAILSSATTKGLNSTDFTKKMRDSFCIESILRKQILTSKKRELFCWNKCKNKSFFLTMRTVARHRMRKICLDLISHSPTMTSASIFHTIIVFVNYSIISYDFSYKYILSHILPSFSIKLKTSLFGWFLKFNIRLNSSTSSG